MSDELATPPPNRPRSHAAAIFAEWPRLHAGWPTCGRGAPTADILNAVTREKWPTVRALVALPDGSRRYETCVPLAWLHELARRCGVPVGQYLIGVVTDG